MTTSTPILKKWMPLHNAVIKFDDVLAELGEIAVKHNGWISGFENNYMEEHATFSFTKYEDAAAFQDEATKNGCKYHVYRGGRTCPHAGREDENLLHCVRIFA